MQSSGPKPTDNRRGYSIFAASEQGDASGPYGRPAYLYGQQDGSSRLLVDFPDRNDPSGGGMGGGGYGGFNGPMMGGPRMGGGFNNMGGMGGGMRGGMGGGGPNMMSPAASAALNHKPAVKKSLTLQVAI